MKPASSGRPLPPDPGLLDRLRTREPAAFDEVVHTYRGLIFRFILRSVRDRQAAEDLTQETFIKLYRHAPTLVERDRFLSWLFRTARTTVIDQKRRQARERRAFEELVRSRPLVAPALDSNRAEAAEEREQLRAVIHELPEIFRTPLLMREIEGMRYQQIAEILGLPEKTISSRISRARRMIAEALRRTRSAGDAS